MKSETEKLIELRKFVLALIGISIIASISYFLIPLPGKIGLLKDEGVIEKVTCICRNEEINGYKFSLNNKVYTLKWLDFRLDKSAVNSMSEGQLVTFFYEPIFFGLFGKKIYAVTAKDKTILEYEFLKHKYAENDGKVKAVLPYILLIFVIGFCIIHLMIKYRQSASRLQNQ